MTPAPLSASSRRPRFGWMINSAGLMLSITMLCWAGNFIVGRWSSGHVPPVMLAWLRWTLATALVAPFAIGHVRRDWPAIRASAGTLLLLGVTGGGLFNSLQYIGLNHTSALNALLINSSGPVFVALACLALFGDRLTLAQWAGIAVSVIGVLIVGTKGSLADLGGITFATGDYFMLAAMTTWGIYTAFLRWRPQIHFLSFALVQMVIAAVLNIPFMLWERAQGAVIVPSLRSLVSIVYCAIFPSIVAYICYNRGVQLIGGARAGAYIHLTTLFGAILSILLLGEHPQAYHAAGFALIIAGVVAAALGIRRG